MVDRAEAVGNIETALSSVFNAFHSLYDALGKAPSRNNAAIDWYQNGPLATILALRNARHHNKANKIRTLYNYHAREAARPDRLTMYVLLNFPSPEEGADTFEVYLSWSDFDRLLSMPKSESRLDPNTSNLIRSYLDTDRFPQYAHEYDLPASRVFFNVVPLIVNAAATITPVIKSSLKTFSSEGEIYSDLFADMKQALVAHPDVNCGPIALMN